MLLVVLQVQLSFLLRVVLELLLLLEQIEEQLELQELLELQSSSWGCFDFVLQHWQLEHRSLVFLEQLVVLVFLLLVLQLLELPLVLWVSAGASWVSAAGATGTALLSSFTGLDKSLTATVWSSTVTWFVVKSALATVASVASCLRSLDFNWSYFFDHLLLFFQYSTWVDQIHVAWCCLSLPTHEHRFQALLRSNSMYHPIWWYKFVRFSPLCWISCLISSTGRATQSSKCFCSGFCKWNHCKSYCWSDQAFVLTFNFIFYPLFLCFCSRFSWIN